jgi:hypothetical protein
MQLNLRRQWEQKGSGQMKSGCGSGKGIPHWFLKQVVGIDIILTPYSNFFLPPAPIYRSLFQADILRIVDTANNPTTENTGLMDEENTFVASYSPP